MFNCVENDIVFAIRTINVYFEVESELEKKRGKGETLLKNFMIMGNL